RRHRSPADPVRGLANSKRSTAPSNGMDAKSSAGVPLSSPAAAQRRAEGAGLDTGPPAEAQSAMPSIAALTIASTADHLSPTPLPSMAPQLQSRISTSLTDVTLFAAIYPLLVVSGFVVGMLVGLTGVGGGSLMTPLLVLLFGVHATTAVGTDLLYAAITKTGGTLTHGLKGTVDWRGPGRLAAGSIPATILTLFALHILGINGNASPPLITTALGIALVMTAICVLSHRWLRLLTAARHAEPAPWWTAPLTTFAGLLLG